MSQRRNYQSSNYNNYKTNNGGSGGSGGGFGLGGVLLIIALVIGVYNNQKGVIPTEEIKQNFSSESVIESTYQDSSQPAWVGYSQTGGEESSTTPNKPLTDESNLDAVPDYTSLIYRLHTEYLRVYPLTGSQQEDNAITEEPSGVNTGSSIYYKNCEEVIAQGKAPLTQDDPGYRLALDTNKDGVACEG